MISFYKEFTYRKRLRHANADEARALVGRLGELRTCTFVKKKGYRILKKNWRHKHGEIDIIVRDKDCLVFIEVRTRNENALVTGVDSICRHKRMVLKKTAHAYMSKIRNKPTSWRFDVAEVCYNSKTKDLKVHYREAVSF